MTTPSLETLHRAAGAALTGEEPPAVLTYGSVPDEYRAGQEGCLLLDRTGRDLVVVEGADRAEFLHRLMGNRVLGLEPGGGNRNLLLSPKGKVLFDADLEVDRDAIRLSLPAGGGPALRDALEIYHFSEDVTIAERGAEHAPIELCGPRSREVVGAVLGALPDLDLHEWVDLAGQAGAVRVSAVAVAGSPGLRLDAGPTGVEALWRALLEAGATPGGRVAEESLRIEAGAAKLGADIDSTIYPQEARLELGFDLEKGCYIGQEVVAKIDTYGGMNKRLMGLHVSHDDPVEAGTRLMREEDGEWRDLGQITSWAYSFALDGGMVLGYVKRKHQAPGTEFRLGDGPGRATIVGLPVRSGALPVTGDGD